MNLLTVILKEHSKANCARIVKWIGGDQRRFNELLNLFLQGEHVVKQRAGWPLGYAVAAHPHLIRKHVHKLLSNLRQPGLHDAVKRNTVRILQDISIPEKFEGEVMSLCFDYISTPNEKPAVKAYSLSILNTLSKKYPEIKQELEAIIESRWEYESAAFKARARIIRKER